ncbi:MAG: dephospho-CoA kinase [Gammaproteobacteria bacterium]|jgi:dephospho-CoA kinase|nr:dephospho-CoA kinase [Chromatiales bacterium]MDP6675420.1 dephospho-CoA kinase [Gammaproteobacteria bacterium]
MEPANDKPRSNELRIGLTGGIASGKSTVAAMFAEYGVPIIDTDVIARQVVEPGQPGLAAVTDRFGTDLLTRDGYLDRHRLRNLVFTDEDQRHALEAILHPLIRTRTLELANQAGGPYQVLVVPLLVETNFDALVDRVLVTDCPESLQRTRLLARDDETPERIEQILAAQVDRRERLAAADDVIDNAGTPAQTRAQVAALHALYLQLA